MAARPLAVAAALVALFAIFHGYAHGPELPPGRARSLYSIGFVVATGCLHLTGIGLGTLVRWPAGATLVRAGESHWPGGPHVPRPRHRPTGMSRRVWVALLAGTVAGAVAPVAEAHLVNTDLGPFYGGLVHPLTALEDLLPLMALGLLAGQQGASAARRMLVLLPLGLAGGAWLFYPRSPWAGTQVLTLSRSRFWDC